MSHCLRCGWGVFLSVGVLLGTRGAIASEPIVCKPVAREPLVVHEWGTFTELQDAAGNPLPRVNTDDEPVPAFVHGFGASLLRTGNFGKRLPFEYNDLTVRLETPVIYFYPPSNCELPMTVDVHVGLRNGWLSEFYPNAKYTAPGLKDARRIKPGSQGTLTWKRLKIGGDGFFPQTDEAVWLHPRNTRSAVVTNQSGESEKYLFYRGVGEFSGPVRVQTNRQSMNLQIGLEQARMQGSVPVQAWLVQVREDGALAFRQITDVSSTTVVSYRFDSSEFDAHGISRLRRSMHASLVANGLYSDEASSMLSTWNRAYFQAPGLRFFYVVPKSWVEEQMPLTITGDTQIQRVMVGRIELISDSQVELVRQLRLCEQESPEWLRALTPEQWKQLNAAEIRVDELGFSVPPAYASYLKLGRFREAILHAEFAKRPSEQLHAFMQSYGMRPANLPGVKQSNGQLHSTVAK